MKKIIISLVFVLTAFASAFAGDEDIEQRVKKTFNKEFAEAKDVQWSVERDLYKATFTYHGRSVSAFYNKKAYRIGVTKYMSSTELPYHLQRELREYYNEYWVVNLFELSNDNGTSYHAIIQNADETLILSSVEENSWVIYKQFDNQ